MPFTSVDPVRFGKIQSQDLRDFFLNLDDKLRPFQALLNAMVFLAKIFELGQQRIGFNGFATALGRLEPLQDALFALAPPSVVRFDE